MNAANQGLNIDGRIRPKVKQSVKNIQSKMIKSEEHSSESDESSSFSCSSHSIVMFEDDDDDENIQINQSINESSSSRDTFKDFKKDGPESSINANQEKR
jgi:hypothetical protein